MISTAKTNSPHGRRVSPRTWAFVAVLVVYIGFSLAVVYQSPVLSLDGYLRDYRASMTDSWRSFISWYVAFGQRGPSTLVFLPFFIWIAWRKRSAQPLVLLGTALVLLNLSVGIVKVIIGRLGPLRTADTHAVFVGGNIYPSGHVSNTVVLYGLMAWIALEYRRVFIVAAVWLSLSVGLATVYLNTHWFSDVVGGWLAGVLVLLALPWVVPSAERVVERGVARWRNGRSRSPQPDAHGSARLFVDRHLPPRHAVVGSSTRDTRP